MEVNAKRLEFNRTYLNTCLQTVKVFLFLFSFIGHYFVQQVSDQKPEASVCS